MNTPHKPQSPAWHKSRASGYLTAVVLLLLTFFVGLMPAAPLFLKLFVPYPTLEQAEHWQGTFSVQGKVEGGRRFDSVRLPRYFIDTPQGRKEFHCGLIGRRYTCNSQHRLDEARGEVWYHPLFGSLQRRFVVASGPGAGQLIDVPYAIIKEVNYDSFDYARYLWFLVWSVVPLAGLIFFWHRYRKHSVAARMTNEQSPAV
ncbi:MAG: hypothetical protein HC937_00950 [Aquincola sp.]|nr:hypothetical protein [Aquincola sp.]